MKTQCEEFKNDCQYSLAGCSFKGNKKEMKIHCEQNVAEHLSLSFSMNLKVIEEVKRLNKKVSNLNVFPKEEIKKIPTNKSEIKHKKARSITVCDLCESEIILKSCWKLCGPCHHAFHEDCAKELKAGML